MEAIVGHKGEQSQQLERGGGHSEPKKTKRRGRTPLCLEHGEQLWHWLVDRIAKVPGIINTGILLTQSTIYLQDTEDALRIQTEAAARSADDAPILPNTNEQWVKRWRSAFGVTFRTVNRRYKISSSRRRFRLKVFVAQLPSSTLLPLCVVRARSITIIGF